MIRDVEALLARHEGFRRKPYLDTVGKTTIGIGRNLDDVGISRVEALCLLRHDLAAARQTAVRYPWFEDLNEPRQAAILDMIVNLGAGGFRRFVKTRRYLADADYRGAAREMLRSRWATQVGPRAIRLSRMIHTGQWPNR